MAQHHAFGLASGTGRIHQRRNLPGRIDLDRLGSRRFVELTNADTAERTDPMQFSTQSRSVGSRFLGNLGRDENSPGTAVRIDLIKFTRRKAWIYHNWPRIESLQANINAANATEFSLARST